MSATDERSLVAPDPEIVELLTDFFAREVTPEVVDAAERAGALPRELWERAEAVEIPWIGIAEEHGGVGGTSADAVAMLQLAGHRATPLPLLEHHVAVTLLGRAGVEPVAGPLTLAGASTHEPVPQVVDGVLSGEIQAVPWAGEAAGVVVLTTDQTGRDVVVLVRREDYTVAAATDMAGIPGPRVRVDSPSGIVGELVGGAAPLRRHAEVMRSAVLAGLTQRLYDITARYVSERRQFGKPVGSFQSVQVHVVGLAQAAAMSTLGVERAAGAVALGAGEFEVDAMTVVVEQNAARAAAAAHQAHGAIGMTREYPLQQVTRRVHSMLQVWAPSCDVQARVGRMVLASPSLSELVARHPEEGLPST
ncbi:acyl-CoA dehydrogenase family protein [Janibacter alittae]|uniref:Acyl-CoA dehydrogenase family protein n=1 Tax=Janibacter alittae TaxID=3115209 RepID=A0ABZ2MG26_9MICO